MVPKYHYAQNTNAKILECPLLGHTTQKAVKVSAAAHNVRLLNTKLSEESMLPQVRPLDEKSSAWAWSLDLTARPLCPKNEKR